MPLQLARFDPSPFDFPRPKVPLLPNRTVSSGNGIPITGFFKTTQYGFRSFARGRYALGAAYRLCGIGPEKILMAPAYHCLSMLDPAIALGAKVLLYPLRPDLSPDIEKFDALFSETVRPVGALLATHYFGLAQNFAPLRNWCAARGITLIEDCSHVLFTETVQAPRTGVFGKYVTTSPYKFFACEDGGLLCAAEPGLLDMTVVESPSWRDEARGFKYLLEKRRPPPLADTGSASTARPLPAETPLFELAYGRPSPYFVPADARKSALRLSRWLVRRASVHDLAAARRRNYARWLDATAALPNCLPLYPDWPADGVPYMFPLLIDTPLPHFFLLKQAGMPIWRWDEMAISDCPVSRRYQLHLLHLPCHQGLDEAQMDWMIDVLRSVLRRTGEDGCREAGR